MNFDNKISYLESELKETKKLLESAREFTQTFLNKCGEKGITRVSICKRHNSIPESVTWPFGLEQNVFAFQPKSVRKKNTWPPIWGVVEELEIVSGAGNNDQQQADTSNLIDGVYHLKKGKWIRVDR